MSVKKSSLNRAIAMLKAIDASFEIRFEDEIFVYGEVHPKPVESSRKVRFDYGPLKIRERLGQMRVGDVQEFQLDLPGLSLDMLQSRLCAAAGDLFGKGSVITQRSANKVEVLRVI